MRSCLIALCLAAGGTALVTSTSRTFAVEDALNVFDGVWVSVTPPGPHVVFNRIGLQTREASLPSLGQASITTSNGENGSNYRVSGEGFSCLYLILTTNQRSKMVWDLKSGQSVCMKSAVLERADDISSPDASKNTSSQTIVRETALVPQKPPLRTEPSLLEMISSGRWCTSQRSYSLQFEGNTITWRANNGTDTESIVYNNSSEAKTRTQRSVHTDSGSVAVGTTWIYTTVGSSKINVVKEGGGSFVLTRC